MTSDAPAIRIQNLSYHYTSAWTYRKSPGISDITLDVQPGEAFGFLGHNGAGKTTTIKCLLDLVHPSNGKIEIFGRSSRNADARRSVGYLPEQPYFYDHLSVFEMMSLYATLAGIERREMKRAIGEALDLVSMSSRRNQRLRSLSKGLTQRVAMAQALLGNPKLLVLDEPFSGLDPLGRKEFVDLLVHLEEQGTTIFMSSHILSDVEFLCERVSILSNGQLKGVFDLRQMPELIKGSYELTVRNYESQLEQFLAVCDDSKQIDLFLRLVFHDKGRAEEALRLAIETDASVESFQFVHGGLEELFLSVISDESVEAGADR